MRGPAPALGDLPRAQGGLAGLAGRASALVVLPEPPGATGGGHRPRAIDGGRLVGAAVDFSRELRRAGLAIDLGAVMDFVRAMTIVGIDDRDAVRAAGAAVFVRRHEDLDAYHRAFDRFWRPGRTPGQTIEPPTALVDERADDPADEPAQRRDAAPVPEPSGQGVAAHAADRREVGEGPPEAFDALVISPHAYSAERVDRQRQFDRMSSGELRDAERFIDRLLPNLERRRTRRRELHRRGRIPAPRAMLRRNLKTGGDPVEWVWQRPVHRPRSLVVLCDISGSMERQSRLLLRFSQALAASAVRTEAFVFGTRLTRVSRLLRDRDRDRALARVAGATTDWSGGTRIGDCLREFSRTWSRRVLRSSSVVVIVSDGWDRGEPRLVAREMARLRRSCHRIIWLNPLASAPGYQPLAGGMAAALPYVDDFVPAGTLASLEHLAELLAGGSESRGRRPRR